MKPNFLGKVAILYPGDRKTRQNATPQNNRLATIFEALERVGIAAEPAVYHDDFCDEVKQQLLKVDGVLVWMNPIQDGRTRGKLDEMLRSVANHGVFVSTHPDIILKMGTKEVLYKTRHMGWGSDTHLYSSFDQLKDELPIRLFEKGARVLKQYRGNGGLGIWKVELMNPEEPPDLKSTVKVRQGRRGCYEENLSLEAFLNRCKEYFENNGKIIDQAYQERLPEGMIRAYLVRDKVAGFGHQDIVALHPAPPGADPTQAPDPTPRLYYPPDMVQWNKLKTKLEKEWVQEMQDILDISTDQLPVLWDCDFLLGPKDENNEDTYVLCEINVSSVAPYPESAPPYIAEVMKQILSQKG